MVKTLQELTRPNIWRLKPYSSARDEYNGAAASVFLDANENPYNMPHNRYPDPMQRELKTELSRIKKVSPDSIFLGNGSDEAIDLVFRAFCEPRVDNVVAIDPVSYTHLDVYKRQVLLFLLGLSVRMSAVGLDKRFQILPLPQQMEIQKGKGISAGELSSVTMKGEGEIPVLGNMLDALPRYAVKGVVSKKFLTPEDHVLIIDDFLANG